MFKLSAIEQGLAAHEPNSHTPGAKTRQASVALILRQRPEAPAGVADILFIRRSEKDGDPWSGHMAFPGGHRDPGDASLLHAATRETREEIGLDLDAHGRTVGTLDQHRANPRGRVLDMLIAPFVFILDTEPPLRPNHEVAEVVWTPLAPMASGSIHTCEQRVIGGTPTTFNGYRINGGHFVWGLTYRVVHSFFAALDKHWEPPPEIE